MIGTDKQVTWALEIQAKTAAPYLAKLAQLETVTGLDDATTPQEFRDNIAKAKADTAAAVELINSVSDAKWWIDNRATASLLKIKRAFQG